MQALNTHCPWSGEPVSPQALTRYRDVEVGFCNSGCRDKFAAATVVFDKALEARREARSLRALAGMADAPPQLTEAALVVIDAQCAYRAGPLALPDMEAALARLAALLGRARDAGATVIHVAHRGGGGSPFDPAGGGAFLPQAAPRPGEAVVKKSLPNAFADTDLRARIGDRPAILAGFMTHMCVSATARAALDLGVAAAVAGDACATRDLPDPLGGGDLPAAALHRAALAAIADRFASVWPVARWL